MQGDNTRGFLKDDSADVFKRQTTQSLFRSVKHNIKIEVARELQVRPAFAYNSHVLLVLLND